MFPYNSASPSSRQNEKSIKQTYSSDRAVAKTTGNDLSDDELKKISSMSEKIEHLEAENKVLTAEVEEKIKSYQREMKSLQTEKLEISEQKRHIRERAKDLEKEMSKLDSDMDEHRTLQTEILAEHENFQSITNDINRFFNVLGLKDCPAHEELLEEESRLEREYDSINEALQLAMPKSKSLLNILCAVTNSSQNIPVDANAAYLYPSCLLRPKSLITQDSLTLEPKDLELVAFHLRTQQEIKEKRVEQISSINQFIEHIETYSTNLSSQDVKFKESSKDLMDKILLMKANLSKSLFLSREKADQKELSIQNISREIEKFSSVRKVEPKVEKYRNALRNIREVKNRDNLPSTNYKYSYPLESPPIVQKYHLSQEPLLTEPAVLEYLTQVDSFANDEKAMRVIRARYLKLTGRPLKDWNYTSPIYGRTIEAANLILHNPRFVSLKHLHVTLRDTNNIVWLAEVWCDDYVRGIGHSLKKGEAIQIAAEQATLQFKVC
ncbi:Schizosaccharomyces specific family with conserved tryptophan [Schizosaccharomyces osmophilus]|uniref:Schizosaccharomyces specific family with conserved tryptophan n=1 Tax=Schizosaccharomyces osmophilus TaxID=2545709 RepID=A0AAE9W8N3_9SCHI|nr:Schizosaccharomyces specific family with conserved tryptophan [Schizosaccharomyces osmophilus]WBW71365.1 Schizosaccharomyces specific family with conserved tryptophan [Schizosaccharomyces osmophilus]